MAKSRKKKNYKLRRRVKRTIAALTMVMAIVVAAIPVENYGTMQAAGETEINMATERGNDDSTYFGDLSITQESAYTGAPFEVQQLQSDGNDAVSVVKAYMATPNAGKTNAIVSGKGELSEITVNSTEYYGYKMVNAETLVTDLNSAVFPSDMTVEFEQGASVNLSGGYYATGPAGEDGTIPTASLAPITTSGNTLNKIKDDTFRKSSSITLPPIETGLTASSGSIELDWNNSVIADCEKDAFADAKKNAADYNEKIGDLEAIQAKLAATSTDVTEGQVLSAAEVNAWTTYTALQASYDASRRFTLTSQNLTSSQTSGLPLLYEYILNTYYSMNGVSLTNFNFVRGTYDGRGVYLFRHTSDKGTTTSPLLDDNGYLAEGKVTITGVKNSAFSGTTDATNISAITLPATIEFIGKQAFYQTALTSIVIPAATQIVAAGAFEGSALESVTFEGVTNTGKVELGAYAFYDCAQLKSVAFATDKEYEILKGAFAVPAERTNVMSDFAFPAKNEKIAYNNESNHDCILAGRSDLQSVTFGANLNDTIPANTLRGCANLARATFESTTAKYETYNTTTKEVIRPQLFCDVTNSSFMVYGPQKKSDTTTDADPLVSSWTAYYGGKNEEKPVPYQYGTAPDIHIEIGYNGGETIAQIDVLEGNKAVLTKYKKNTAPGMPVLTNRLKVIVPARVGNYDIVEIGKDCFDQAVREKVYNVTIEDGHVVAIDAEAFDGCDNLEWVFIGNSVRSIGANAFSNCKKLENVEFSTTGKLDYRDGKLVYGIGDDDETWANELAVDDTAFNTQSSRLTFHGAVHSGYRPFEIAMSPNNSSLLSSGRQICYKTDEPLNLTVMRNRHDGKATLIDYPHYQEIDIVNSEYIKENHESAPNYSITDTFEERCVDSDAGMDSPVERAIVEAALNIELPRGIQRVSTHKIVTNSNGEKENVGFFDGTANEDDFEYVKYQYVFKEGNLTTSNLMYEREGIATGIRATSGSKMDITQLYSVDGYIEDSQYAADYALPKDEKVARGGLFSGYFNDDNSEVSSRLVKEYGLKASGNSSGLIGKTYNNHEYEEIYESGNDYLTTVNMATVEELPDYVFDNCENLLRAYFSTSLSEIGALPFRGCKNVYDVNVGAGNQNFMVQNMMLFASNGDGRTYTIKECFEGRGKGNVYGSSMLLESEFPEGVTAIEDRAFANCDYLTKVDMSATEVVNIPEDCFRNSKLLNEVTLPNTVRRIETGALVGVNSSLTLTIPTPNCVITSDAVDGKADVLIRGPQYMADGKTPSDLYGSYENLVKNYGETKIHFADLGNTFKVEFVDRDLRAISGYENIEVDKGGSLTEGQIATAPEIDGYDFVTWMCRVDGEVLTGTKAGDPAFRNINEDRLYYPSYEANPKKVVSDGNLYTFSFENATATLVSGSETVAAGTQLKSGDKLEGGATISLIASNQARFQYWSAANGDTSFNNMFSGNTNNYIITFTMPNANVTVTAHLSGSGGNNPSDPDDPNATKYTVTVRNGTGSGQYAAGATVTITANTPNAGASFVNWTTDSAGVSFASATSATTTFSMPASNVTVTANFSDGTGGQPSGGNTGDNTTKYKVTVNYGSGSGEYAAGTTVNISAYAPESSSRVFSRWTTNNSGLGFANANAASTSFIMPAADVTVTANYKVRTDDDDDDSPSRRPGTNTTTTTVSNRPGSSTTTTSTTGTVNNPSNGSTTSTSNDGNRIYITKNGVSNKDVASISVDGSTDNFIVRITESAEATAEVEKALTNRYGSLDGLVYFPMDISLYDSTGQNKITDTYGLNITVTMPIPDVLIQYGGNARVAAADNGNLQEITPRFTTIDGIACISFIPPHFSPYVIYVDTHNLVAGQMLDSTPATGDPIHPKWFAAIGMACISILLFVTSDGRKRKNYRAA